MGKGSDYMNILAVTISSFGDVLNLYIDSWINNLLITAFAHLFIILLIRKLYKNALVYFGTKKYVTNANKQRRDKFNGVQLNEFTQKRRKRKTNTYKHLRSKAKVKVESYFRYKEDELPGVTNYSYSKLFKRNKDQIMIFVSNGKKKVMKIHMKKAHKKFIELVNQYECLDEFVIYLHNLPEAILNHEDYDIYLNDTDISIGYEVK